MKFKNGDKVIIMGATHGWGNAKKGDVGVVVDTTTHTHAVGVDILDRNMIKHYFAVEDVKLFKPPATKNMLNRVVIDEKHMNLIKEALNQVSGESYTKIFKTWGFEETIEKGRGLVFLFYGEPGTGKTLCAEAIAEMLGKNHTIVTTADIQSSIPGQAERNIKEMFKKGREQDLVLVFDECDSLLYNRNSVGAILGAEINCLLGEIERFEGVVILTTNRNVILDPALERRVALKLEFKRPNKVMRQKIWRNLVPTKCPLDKDVCFERLSEYDLTGGNIKNAVLAAARSAVYTKKEHISLMEFEVAALMEISSRKAFKKTTPSLFSLLDDVVDGMSVNDNSNERTVTRRRVKSAKDCGVEGVADGKS